MNPHVPVEMQAAPPTRREVRKAYQRWGTLPPDREGLGLALFIIGITGLVVQIFVIFAGWNEMVGSLALIASSSALLVGAIRNNRWLAQRQSELIAKP